ncbi:MAG: 4-hydroxythreonine-4-phosphate dehydrogenase PdxA [Candidatus Omnitrophota bacterium]
MIKPRIIITMGDPSGIGPEVIFKGLNNPGIAKLAEFAVIGDRWAFNKAKSEKRKAKNFKFIDLNNVPRNNFKFGKVDARYGRASFEYLELAVKLIKEKKADCLVTAPVDKEAVNKAGIKFNGHTEYLAGKFNIKDFLMMLIVGKYYFTLVTRHVALKDVSKQLTQSNIFKTIIITNQSLKKIFNIKKPRICVCGLNPHASDGGIFGDEEKKVITPAIIQAKNKGCLVYGPIPADSAVKELVREKKYDVLVAMYHDQALIPLKILGYEQGVNFTCGLPFIRTTPLHGTAFDIAGKNKANPGSIIEAIKLAVETYCNASLQKQ